MELTEKKDHVVLVVDDEPANLRLMERVLRRYYTVLTANDGQAALEILKREKISVLLTDQRMPGMTGVELLQESLAINPDLVRMMITANTDNDTFAEAINKGGALRVIHKPWDPKQVLQFMNDAIAQRETVIEGREANAQIGQVMDQLRRAAESLNLFIRKE
jgi:response regulator RpfG family c-di-GMP phosphodiesterase